MDRLNSPNALLSILFMGFKEENRVLKELDRELAIVRANNLAIKEGDSQEKLLFFAEAALVLMRLEHFLRVLPGINPTDSDVLYNLLEKAIANNLIVLPTNVTNQEVIKQINSVRNTMLHANYAQAANDCGLTIPEYFKSQFASEVESLFKLTENLISQIDPITGKRKAT